MDYYEKRNQDPGFLKKQVILRKTEKLSASREGVKRTEFKFIVS